MENKGNKNKLEIHKEATEWSKKINIVYEKLLNGSETCRRFLNFYNTHLGKKSGIVSIQGNLRILNHQTFSRNETHSDFFDFNSKCLSMSFFMKKKFFVKNHISEEWIYVEIEDFEIEAMEFDDISDPTEKNIQLTIHPAKYFILDSAGKNVHNIPELEKLVIEICDETGMNKCFRENIYARYKNRTKIHDDAITKGDDESLLSFATYNTDFCNSSMIEQVKNRNLSINTSFQEKEPTSYKPTRILNIIQQDLAKSNVSDVCSVMTQKHNKKSEELYSSIDYGRRLENEAFQLEKNVQKVRPMSEKPPKRSTQQVEPFILINTSIPVVDNKKPVKLPKLPRTEALIIDVYDSLDDGGDSPIVPYKSFISQEREKKNRLLDISSAMEEKVLDTEDFTLDSIENENYIRSVPIKSSMKLPVLMKPAKPARRRSIKTRSKKETKFTNNEISPNKVTILPVSSKSASKTRKHNVKQMTPASVIKKPKSLAQNARNAIFYSSSEDNFELKNNDDNDPDTSDMDMDVVIHPKAPSKAIESLMAAKKKREERKAKEQKSKDVEKEKSYKQKSLVELIEKKDPVQIVKNVTFCEIISPDNKHQYQDVQKVERKRKSKGMADIDEIIQYDMEVNNQQMQEASPRTNKAINPKDRDLSVEFDNGRFKNMRLSTAMFSADADWNVINTAIDDPKGSNPEVVKNSILNILRDLQMPKVRPTTAAPVIVPPPVIAPIAKPPPVVALPPTKPPQQIQFFNPFQDLESGLASQFFRPRPQPTVDYVDNAGPMMPQQQPRPRPQPALDYGPNYVQLMPQYRPAPYQTPKPCGKESVAEFMVNVPCPTSTQKPVREIVVKVPCPTTTEKPCQCQCCPCSPCTKKQKKPKKAEVIYVSSEEEEPCKLPKSYKKPKKEHKRKESKVMYEESSEEEEQVEVSSEESDEVEINPKPAQKQHKSIYTHFTPNVRSYTQPKKQQNDQPTIVYQPSGGYQRVQIKEKKDYDN
ncbi:unnamed protein product [Diamesa serratosioi]